ncbi:MAG: DUF1844 domain-containing protein [Acidobacteriota bacterium]
MSGNGSPSDDKQKWKETSTIDFSSFVLSMSAQALVSLGEAQNPITGESKLDLEAAKQAIDILCMLKEKSKGNLSASESELIENILYDLRIRYVTKSKEVKN